MMLLRLDETQPRPSRGFLLLMCLSRYSESSESVVQFSCGVAALNSLGEAETTATRTFNLRIALASVELTPHDRGFSLGGGVSLRLRAWPGA